MAKIHTLTYNGTKSSDLGVFVSGSGSFDAAELDVDKYEIPGRNGDLILSNNRYKNVEITYPAFIPKAFMDKVQNVRNWLRSSRVYARLEDTYDMDHYRLGIPTGVQSFSPENRNDGANFEMTFDCKPQRFLKVGETPETVEADVNTETGEIVTFETVAESPITSASVSLSPIQDLNGYESPWPAGGGKNKFPKNATDSSFTKNGITFTANNGVYTIEGTAETGISTYFTLSDTIDISPSTKKICFLNSVGSTGVVCRMMRRGSIIHYWTMYNANYVATGWTDTGNENINQIGFNVTAGTTVNITISPVLLDLSDANATNFIPWENICPISGHTGAELNIAAEYDAEDKTTYSVTFTDHGTVYGGTYDFVSGKLTVTWKRIIADGVNIKTTGSYGAYGPLWLPAIVLASADYIDNSVLQSGTASYLYWNYHTIQSRENTICSGNGGHVIVLHIGSMQGTDGTHGYNSAAEVHNAVNAYLQSNPLEICYLLATPLEYTLSPQQLTTLLEQNVVWGSGPITLTYAEPYNIENPTLFDARPLFTVTNPEEGDVIMVNGQAITFVDGYAGTVYIDCETMNAFSGAANLNSIIQATDFPVLVPGTNTVTWTGAGECTMTPRWWEL